MKEGSILIHPVSGYERAAAQVGALHTFEELYVEEDAAPETEGSSWLTRLRRMPGQIHLPIWKQKPKDQEAADE
jgi:hypothetical protein